MKNRFVILNFFIILSFLTYYFSPDTSLYSLLSTTTSSPLLHLLHVLFICTIFHSITQYIIYYYYKEIRIQEMVTLNDNMHLFITDILLVLTIFNRDINYRNLIIFYIILCIKNIQWISTLRNDNINCNILICFISSILSYLYLDKINLHFLFTFEFLTISLASLRNICSIKIQEKENKSIYIFLLEIIYLFLLLSLYSIFIILTSIKYKIPLNVFRSSINILEKLIKKCKAFIKYLNICKDIDKIPNSKIEGECIICQDSEPNKRIRCGHVFHADCLKQWCERQPFCPVCKIDLYLKEEVIIRGNEEIRGVPVEIYNE